MQKKIIYFLCTGNSCRSQMAEGFAKAYLDKSWEVKSAGIEAHGINPKAIEAMEEVDIDISRQTSDIIQQETLQEANLVITLCDDAYENCPVIPANVTHLHWGFEDPAGKDWATFQKVRDAIGQKIKIYFNESVLT